MQVNLFDDVVDGVGGSGENESAVVVFRRDSGQFFASVGDWMDLQRGIGRLDGDRCVDMVREDGAVAAGDRLVAGRTRRRSLCFRRGRRR